MADFENSQQPSMQTTQSPDVQSSPPKMRKYALVIIIGVVLVFVLLGAVFMMFGNRSGDTQETAPPQATEQTEETGITGAQNEPTPSAATAAENDAKRANDINLLMNAIVVFTNDGNTLPESLSTTQKNVSSTGVDICSLLYPTFISALPRDPVVQNGDPILDCSEYDTGYTMHIVDAGGNQVQLIISAPQREGEDDISALRVIQKSTLSNPQP